MRAYDVRQWMLLFFSHLHGDGVYYIGGADPLPKPLTYEEERDLVERLPTDDGTVRSILIERNLRWCLLPRNLKTRRWALRI